MLLASCSNDDLTQEKGQVVKVRVPITLVTGQPMTETTRAIGDPGYDDKLPPTQHLYVWAVYQKIGGSYAVAFRHFKLDDDNWTYGVGDTGNNSENQNSKYTTSELEIGLSDVNQGDDIGKVYVLASNREVEFDDSHWPSTNISGNYSQGYFTQSIVSKGALDNLTFTPTNWTSYDLRDLYSNPIGDDTKDANSLKNGVIKKSGNTITVGNVRLYHCAAKVDFKWEVAEALRSTTSVASITCTGLPTTLKVFAPTENPEGTGTSIVLGGDNAVNALTPENKYIGRAYAYVLQPANNDKKVSYTVTFNGKDNTTTTTEAATNSIYTTWYRVVAEVKD